MKSKYSEIKGKDEKQLLKRVGEAREELREGRFRVHRGEEKDVRRVRELRREIAQILTAIHKNV